MLLISLYHDETNYSNLVSLHDSHDMLKNQGKRILRSHVFRRFT